MPRGPRGEKRPADVIGNAVHVMRIATGEIENAPEDRKRKRPQHRWDALAARSAQRVCPLQSAKPSPRRPRGLDGQSPLFALEKE